MKKTNSKSKNLSAKNLADTLSSFSYPECQGLVEQLLKRRELSGYLPRVLETLKRRAEKENNYNKLVIFSPTELSQENIELILQKIKSKTTASAADVKVVIDTSILAGYVVKCADTVLDGSLKTIIKNNIRI